MANLENSAAGSDLLASLGGTIGAGDNIYIRATLGEQYTTGLDLSGNEADRFVVPPTFVGTLGGASAGGVKLNLSGATYTGLLEYKGGGAYAFFDPETTVKRAILDCALRRVYGTGSGTWTTVEQASADSEFNATNVVTNFYGNGGLARFLDNATAITLMKCVKMTGVGGFGVELKRGVTTAEFRDGTRVLFDNRSRSLATTTIGQGASVAYNGGNMTLVTIEDDGHLDLSYLTQNITITNWVLHPRARLTMPSAGIAVTFTNAPTLIGGGPTWYTP